MANNKISFSYNRETGAITVKGTVNATLTQTADGRVHVEASTSTGRKVDMFVPHSQPLFTILALLASDI